MTSYGDIVSVNLDSGIGLLHQSIVWTMVDLSVKFHEIIPRAISRRVPKLLFCIISLEITLPHLPGTMSWANSDSAMNSFIYDKICLGANWQRVFGLIFYSGVTVSRTFQPTTAQDFLDNRSTTAQKHLRLWWRHDMETLSALLTLCERNPGVTGGFHSHRAQ